MKKKDYQEFLTRYEKFKNNNLPTPFWDEERQTLEYVYYDTKDDLNLLKLNKNTDFDSKMHINYSLTDALGDLASTGFYYSYNSRIFQKKKSRC